jgi:ankyrin repeat protein
MLILDYLNVEDILNLSEDPEFPVGIVRRKHIYSDRGTGTILHTISRLGWTHIPQIRAFMQILGTWDTYSLENLTPLGLAAQNCHYELCRFFIEAGANVNPQRGDSPLWIAAGRPENNDVISLLVKNGADVSWNGHLDRQVILNAVEHANADTVNLLLSFGADAKFFSNAYGSTLHQVRDPAVAKLLIEHGVGVNVYSRISPLMLAATRGLSELVDVFLDAGAEVDHCTELGHSALTRAIDNNHPNIVRRLISAGCEFNKSFGDHHISPLLLAVASENEDIVRILLENGVDVNARGCSENSVLCLAARYSSLSLFRELVAAGAQIDAGDWFDQTPLSEAMYAKREDLVRLLLDARADASLLDDYDIHLTLVLTAGSIDDLSEIVRNFRDFGPNWITHCNYFALEDDEGLESNTSFLKILLDYGADISKANFHGIGILHFAAWRNDLNLVKLLLDRGADATYKDPGGNTPAAWAAMVENPEIEELLREAEADQKKAKSMDKLNIT